MMISGKKYEEAVKYGIIKEEVLVARIEMAKREELLKAYPNAIWQGKDGYWRTKLPDEKRRMIKRSKRESVEDAIVEFMQQQIKHTLDEVFKEWIDHRLYGNCKHFKPATATRYQQIYRKHFKQFGKKNIEDLTEDDILEFLEEQTAENELKSKAYSNMKGVLRGILKRAKKRKLTELKVEETLAEIDAAELNILNEKKNEEDDVFSEEETEKIISYLKENLDIQNYCLLLLFATGMRIGEAVAVKKEDIFEDHIKICRTETRYQNADGKYIVEIREGAKTKEAVREVVIAEGAEWILRELEKIGKNQEYVFEENGIRKTTQSIRMRLYRICKKLGIKPKSPHKVRKTYCSMLFDAKVAGKIIQKQMGHTDIRCSVSNYYRDRKKTKEKQEILNAVPEMQLLRA